MKGTVCTRGVENHGAGEAGWGEQCSRHLLSCRVALMLVLHARRRRKSPEEISCPVSCAGGCPSAHYEKKTTSSARVSYTAPCSQLRLGGALLCMHRSDGPSVCLCRSSGLGAGAVRWETGFQNNAGT